MKIKCMLGRHDWRYEVTEIQSPWSSPYVYHAETNVPIRRCSRCDKWERTDGR